jgi:hypothetical protein
MTIGYQFSAGISKDVFFCFDTVDTTHANPPSSMFSVIMIVVLEVNPSAMLLPPTFGDVFVLFIFGQLLDLVS